MKDSNISLRTQGDASNVGLFEGQIASNKPASQSVLLVYFQIAITHFSGTIAINLHSLTGRSREAGMRSSVRARESSLFRVFMCMCESMPGCEFWIECPLKFKTALIQLTSSTSWDVNMWT